MSALKHIQAYNIVLRRETKLLYILNDQYIQLQGIKSTISPQLSLDEVQFVFVAGGEEMCWLVERIVTCSQKLLIADPFFFNCGWLKGVMVTVVFSFADLTSSSTFELTIFMAQFVLAFKFHMCGA